MTAAPRTILAGRLLARPGVEPVRASVGIDVVDGVVTGVRAVPAAEVTAGGADGLLAIPALANAHDHGRGVRYLAYGGADRALECWLPSIYFQPDVDPYVNAAVAVARHARAGIGAAVNFHIINRPEAFEAEVAAVARAARDVGIRIALVIPMRDQNLLAYGADESLLSLLPAADRAPVVELWRRPVLPPADQLARALAAAASGENELVSVQLGPIGVQWCSDRLLRLVADESSRSGRRVHMHLLETRYQREWADARYAHGVVRFLDEIGLLSPRLTVAHGVWLQESEIDVLARRGVTVALNTSSNLRLRSGIAPARRLVAAGVPIGFGLDSMALDDDNDALAELRLAYLLHNGPGLRTDLTPSALFHGSMSAGARAVTGASNHGTIGPGMAADVALIDYRGMTADLVDGLTDPMELLLIRGASRYVDSLVVAGRTVVAGGRVTGVDEPALAAEAVRQTQGSAERLREVNPLLQRYQSALMTFYSEGRHAQGGRAR